MQRGPRRRSGSPTRRKRRSKSPKRSGQKKRQPHDGPNPEHDDALVYGGIFGRHLHECILGKAAETIVKCDFSNLEQGPRPQAPQASPSIDTAATTAAGTSGGRALPLSPPPAMLYSEFRPWEVCAVPTRGPTATSAAAASAGMGGVSTCMDMAKVYWVDAQQDVFGVCEVGGASTCTSDPCQAIMKPLLEGVPSPCELATSPDGRFVYFLHQRHTLSDVGDASSGGATPKPTSAAGGGRREVLDRSNPDAVGWKGGGLWAYEVATGGKFEVMSGLWRPRGLHVTPAHDLVWVEDRPNHRSCIQSITYDELCVGVPRAAAYWRIQQPPSPAPELEPPVPPPTLTPKSTPMKHVLGAAALDSFAASTATGSGEEVQSDSQESWSTNTSASTSSSSCGTNEETSVGRAGASNEGPTSDNVDAQECPAGSMLSPPGPPRIGMDMLASPPALAVAISVSSPPTTVHHSQKHPPPLEATCRSPQPRTLLTLEPSTFGRAEHVLVLCDMALLVACKANTNGSSSIFAFPSLMPASTSARCSEDEEPSRSWNACPHLDATSTTYKAEVSGCVASNLPPVRRMASCPVSGDVLLACCGAPETNGFAFSLMRVRTAPVQREGSISSPDSVRTSRPPTATVDHEAHMRDASVLGVEVHSEARNEPWMQHDSGTDASEEPAALSSHTSAEHAAEHLPTRAGNEPSSPSSSSSMSRDLQLQPSWASLQSNVTEVRSQEFPEGMHDQEATMRAATMDLSRLDRSASRGSTGTEQRVGAAFQDAQQAVEQPPPAILVEPLLGGFGASVCVDVHGNTFVCPARGGGLRVLWHMGTLRWRMLAIQQARGMPFPGDEDDGDGDDFWGAATQSADSHGSPRSDTQASDSGSSVRSGGETGGLNSSLRDNPGAMASASEELWADSLDEDERAFLSPLFLDTMPQRSDKARTGERIDAGDFYGGNAGDDTEGSCDYDSDDDGEEDDRVESSVAVVLRCRPLLPHERKRDLTSVVRCDVDRDQVSVLGRKRRFKFRRVYDELATQKQIYYETVAPLVDKALNGFSCTCFAYGPTGSGKTFTMEGAAISSFSTVADYVQSAGMISRAVHSVFRALKGDPSIQQHMVSVSHMEVYNERLYDLLSEQTTFEAMMGGGGGEAGAVSRGGPSAPGTPARPHTASATMLRRASSSPGLVGLSRRPLSPNHTYRQSMGVRPQSASANNLNNPSDTDPWATPSFHPHHLTQPLKLYENAHTGVQQVVGLTEVPVVGASDIFTVLDRSTRARFTAETLLNRQSSRSHAIFTINIQTESIEVSVDAKGKEVRRKVVKRGKLTLVDLCGSENIKRSGSVGERQREAGHIGQSLLVLGRVIRAIVKDEPHVPYRDSKLTRLLSPALGGNAYTVLVLNVAPGENQREETLNTLKYAELAQGVSLNPQADIVKLSLERPEGDDDDGEDDDDDANGSQLGDGGGGEGAGGHNALHRRQASNHIRPWSASVPIKIKMRSLNEPTPTTEPSSQKTKGSKPPLHRNSSQPQGDMSASGNKQRPGDATAGSKHKKAQLHVHFDIEQDLGHEATPLRVVRGLQNARHKKQRSEPHHQRGNQPNRPPYSGSDSIGALRDTSQLKPLHRETADWARENVLSGPNVAAADVPEVDAHPFQGHTPAVGQDPNLVDCLSHHARMALREIFSRYDEDLDGLLTLKETVRLSTKWVANAYVTPKDVKRLKGHSLSFPGFCGFILYLVREDPLAVRHLFVDSGYTMSFYLASKQAREQAKARRRAAKLGIPFVPSADSTAKKPRGQQKDGESGLSGSSGYGQAPPSATKGVGLQSGAQIEDSELSQYLPSTMDKFDVSREILKFMEAAGASRSRVSKSIPGGAGASSTSNLQSRTSPGPGLQQPGPGLQQPGPGLQQSRSDGELLKTRFDPSPSTTSQVALQISQRQRQRQHRKRDTEQLWGRSLGRDAGTRPRRAEPERGQRSSRGNSSSSSNSARVRDAGAGAFETQGANMPLPFDIQPSLELLHTHVSLTDDL